MEQTITMMSEEDTPEVGPNDIVIHLVNPYKCGMCELEFLEKAVFKEHMFSHLDQIKQERPSSQIVMNITLPPETPGGVTVTRDILQLGEDGSIKQVLQPTNSITLNQVSPLRELEEAGVIKLEQPKPEMMTPKRVPMSKPKPITSSSVNSVTSTKIVQQGHPVGLISGGVIPIEGSAEVEGLLKEGLVKEGEEAEAEVSQIVDNKDGSISFAFKGPNDEVQHIQIIRPEGVKNDEMQHIQIIRPDNMKGELMMELAGVPGRRRASRGSNKNNECDICGKILSSSTNLLRHKMYHSAERPFVCEVCNKGFKDVSNLKKHTMIHKRIFPCYLCKKSFLRKSLLAMHLRRHESRTTMVKTGNSTKEVVMRTFVDDDGTRVEEMSMAALGGQTFEYKHRIVKADPSAIDREVKKEIEEEKKALGLSDAGTSTDPDQTDGTAAVDGADGKATAQKPMFTVTVGGLQMTSVDQATGMDNVQSVSVGNAGSSSTNAVDVDDMPDLKLPPVPDEFVKMYQCGHCGKRTVQRGNMMRHLIHHLKEKPFACDECPKQFVDKGELVKHKKTHTKPYRCPQCNGAFAHNVQLMKHLQSECLGNMEHLNYTVMEDGKTYKCDICRIEMKRLGNMIKHVGTHSIGSRKANWSRSSVLNPKRTNFPKPSASIGGSGKPNAPYYFDSTRRAFFCGFCSKSFSQKANVHRHVRMHTKERPYQCTDCDRWFPCATTLKRHAQVHTKPFKCDQCSAAFSRKLFLDTHMRKHSEKERPEDTPDYGLLEDKSGFYCKHCDKKLNMKYRMMNHVKMHLSQRPYECQACNKCFSCQYMLMKHKKVHAKPFVCKTCGDTFTRKFFLVLHRKKMHSFKRLVKGELDVPPDDNEDNKDFICSICGAPFARLVIKMNHEKKCAEESKVMMRLPDGKGFKCKICNKVATLKHNLMVHIRKHDDVISMDASGHVTFLYEENAPSKDEQAAVEQQAKLERPPEKRPRLSTPRKKGSTTMSVDSDVTDEEFVADEESADEDVELEEEGDSRYKRTPGGFACLECRRKFTDRETLIRHLESHGGSQTEEGKKDFPKKEKEAIQSNAEKVGKANGQEVTNFKNKRKEDSADESPIPSGRVSRSSASLSKGKGNITSSPSQSPRAGGSPRNVKSPKGQKSTPSTPTQTEKKDKRVAVEDSITPTGSARRPTRTQKMPSRFLE